MLTRLRGSLDFLIRSARLRRVVERDAAARHLVASGFPWRLAGLRQQVCEWCFHRDRQRSRSLHDTVIE